MSQTELIQSSVSPVMPTTFIQGKQSQHLLHSGTWSVKVNHFLMPLKVSTLEVRCSDLCFLLPYLTDMVVKKCSSLPVCFSY
ncbi:solute carrier family 22 member 6 [Biomphalaria pfeifferi]|uniref:Solute carrier family 22 member 6 n=1 Tax=Biomphalaria pfeifferi TaxID=112525 RepID=A0AAD8F6X4_BIOPF|nr:solute carrier family 22 member 6 [Biomphalaria pfeifferi]